MVGDRFDAAVRTATFEALRRAQQEHGEVLDVAVLQRGVEVRGEHVAIFNLMRGIHSPRQLDAALAVTTAPPKAGKPPPYEDYLDDSDGLFRYHYFGDDPGAPDNRALRICLQQRLPIVYYFGVVPGRYLPFFPAHVAGEDRTAHYWLLDLTGLAVASPDLAADAPERRYTSVAVRARLHQARFREAVLRAYRSSCAVCQLRQVELLDASHILSDAEGGEPTVPNGLALCKLHHAAFDRHLLGVRPDLVVGINRRLLEEVDGPMLVHGLQGFHNRKLLVVPSRRAERPDPAALKRRWERFRAAG